MSDRFDNLSRAMAEPTSRRRALKMLGATALAAAGAVVIRPFTATALTCPAGAPSCGHGCCAKGDTCTDPASSCCCPSGTTPCGQSCCGRGIACVDAGQGLCGCPAGTTPCGSGASLTCCEAGQACGSGCPPASTSGTATSCTPATPTSVCAGRADTCNGLKFIACPNNKNCFCAQTTEATPVCAGGCSNVACSSSTECPSGQRCVANPGGNTSNGCCSFPTGFCAPICGTGF